LSLNSDLIKSAKLGDLLAMTTSHEAGADLDTRVGDSIKKRNILHHASQRGWSSIVNYGLDHSLPVDSLDYHGRTPLYYAVEEGQFDVVKLLVERGAQINLEGEANPLARACECSFNGIEIVEFLLHSGARIDVLCQIGQTPLYSALNQSNPAATTLLLEKGASVDHKDLNHTTPIMHVAHHTDSGHLELLLAWGAKLNGVCKYTGDTALHVAAYYGRANTVQLLLENGELPRENMKGQTPLDIAIQKGRADIVRLLS